MFKANFVNLLKIKLLCYYFARFLGMTTSARTSCKIFMRKT